MEEKLLFQYIMNYKAYRRIMILTRIIITLIVAGGLVGFVALMLPLGIVLPLIALFVGAIWIITALNREITYMVFDTRFVIKNKDKRVSVPVSGIKSVKYSRAFYEKDLATGTVIIVAENESGKVKKYRFKHIFDAAPLVAFFKERIAENNGKGA